MKRAKVVSLGLFSCLFLGSCYSRMDYARQSYLAKGLKEYAQALQTDHDQLEAQNALLRGRVDALTEDAAWVAAQKKKFSELEAKLAGLDLSAGAGIDVIGDAHGNTGFSLSSELLFGSGSNKISAEGQRVLAEVIGLTGDLPLRIDGHTDSDPIQRSTWPSNLALSVGRALSVAQMLMKLGVPEARLTISGLGKTRPTPDADKAKHRRVEIWMLR